MNRTAATLKRLVDREQGAAAPRADAMRPGKKTPAVPTNRPEIGRPARSYEVAAEQIRPETTPEAEYYDETRDAVRIEYEEGEETVGVWLVPERYEGATYEGEPALRRSELAAMLEKGEGAGVLRETVAVLRAFPGARIRGAA